ncbi:MAG: hypothetical protein PHW77_08485 [Eubacteriales bacterium]|nr:hypothetical protein [Eubacteriales bacterium]
MISFYLIFVSSLAAFAFTGIYAFISFALFLLFALISSFARRLFSPAASVIWLTVLASFVWFIYDLLGLTACIICALCIVSGGFFGVDGVRRSGDILFAVGIAFIILSLFFKGDRNISAAEYFIPVSAFSGISSAAVSGKKPLAVLISCIIGGITGAAVYFGGGLFDEIYLYAVLFTVGATHTAFVISGFKKA